VPKNLGLKRPLLISCHGMNQDAPYQKGMLQIESVADTAKFVTVFPQGINNSWDLDGRKDINFILKIIEKMVEQYDIDPGKVYLSGFSMGGMFTYHAMNMIPDRIAAFAPISGYTLNHTGNGIVNAVTVNANARAIPIIHTHGTSDSVVPFATAQPGLDLWISHNHCNATATVTKNYRGASHITRHAWSGGDNGV
jgi:poly(3-hydroxybutyrate) depolymerase